MQCPFADARLHECVCKRRRRHRHIRGFTLVELVAAIVVLGVLAAVASRVFLDLRYDARRASVESVRATLIANLNAARTAYLTQGIGPGNTVRVNGRAVEVFLEGATTAGSFALPPGAPTGPAMFVMMGCGAAPPALGTDVPCESLSGYTAWVQNDWVTLALGPSSDSSCYAAYYPVYSYAPEFPGENVSPDGWVKWGNGTEVFHAPASLNYFNGC